MSFLIIFLSLGSIFINATFCYLPGVRTRRYGYNETIPIKTLMISSSKTQIPYDYYVIEFCYPENLTALSESIGELILGRVLKNTDYKIRKNNEDNKKDSITLCETEFSKAQYDKLKYFIENDYKAHFLLDNLPIVNVFKGFNNKKIYRRGFSLGDYITTNKNNTKIYSINNHLDFTILYHPENKKEFTVVGFEVKTKSVAKTDIKDKNKFLFSVEDEKRKIHFSYSVTFLESELNLISRWDPYFRAESNTLHWFSFFNSVVPVVTLAFIIAFIFLRVLKKDFMRYKLLSQDPEEQLEERGWKLVHGDVFRKPKHSTLFSIILGAGAQILSIIILFIIFSLIGFVTPIENGNIMNTFIFLFILMAFFSGFVSSLVYKSFGRKNYKRIAIYSSLLYPGLNLIVFLILEFILWTQKSSGAVSFLVLLKIFLLWVLISIPLSFYGAYLANKQEPFKKATKVNLIPRQIPKPRDRKNRIAQTIMGGIIPFSAAFIEIKFLMNSLWLDRFYFMVVGLILVFLILVALSSEITIILIYLQLCSEDYEWWWNSFYYSGFSGICVFIYAVYYGIFNLHMSNLIAITLYLGYMLLISSTLFIVMGTIGFFSTFVFLNLIYGTIKVE